MIFGGGIFGSLFLFLVLRKIAGMLDNHETPMELPRDEYNFEGDYEP